ncbi:MAG: hypothetical protein QOK90_00555 [Nitrososphaeraceae archaeon]|nr:hypothetical protein [Nitrososphaeraceae archaeon]
MAPCFAILANSSQLKTSDTLTIQMTVIQIYPKATRYGIIYPTKLNKYYIRPVLANAFVVLCNSVREPQSIMQQPILQLLIY